MSKILCCISQLQSYVVFLLFTLWSALLIHLVVSLCDWLQFMNACYAELIAVAPVYVSACVCVCLCALYPMICYAGTSLSCAGIQRWKSVSFHCWAATNLVGEISNEEENTPPHPLLVIRSWELSEMSLSTPWIKTLCCSASILRPWGFG